MKVVHIITDLKQGGAQKILYKIITENNFDSEHVIISLIGSGHYKEILEQLKIRFYTLGMSNKSLNLKEIRFFSVSCLRSVNSLPAHV